MIIALMSVLDFHEIMLIFLIFGVILGGGVWESEYALPSQGLSFQFGVLLCFFPLNPKCPLPFYGAYS